jgi:hypothetical protein
MKPIFLAFVLGPLLTMSAAAAETQAGGTAETQRARASDAQLSDRFLRALMHDVDCMMLVEGLGPYAHRRHSICAHDRL